MTSKTMRVLTSTNPATGEPLGEVRMTPPEGISAMVERARAAQSAWHALGADGRARCLLPANRMILERAAVYAELLTREMGKPLRDATLEVQTCGTRLPHELASMAGALAPERFEDERVTSIVRRDPFGVCAAITPWNFPFSMPHSLVIPALMAGNSVLLKPSEETPLIAQAYVDLLHEVLPEGVLQVVHGADEQGRALVETDVDLIVFTGSRTVGKEIFRAAGAGLRRVVLELSGKDALIVLADADVGAAAEFAAWNSFRNAGQVCVSTERIYVHESIAETFVARLVECATAYIAGSGLDERSRLGPLINARACERVIAQIDEAVSKGARVAFGHQGHHGLFVAPTVLTHVTGAMAIARDETFGPVACVTTVATEDEAIALANASDLALGAVVFGTEPHAEDVARRLHAGMVGINKDCRGAFGSPWVGAKQSGYGFHGSADGHRQFAQTRVLSRPSSRAAF